jgi:hypothetical protein
MVSVFICFIGSPFVQVVCCVATTESTFFCSSLHRALSPACGHGVLVHCCAASSAAEDLKHALAELHDRVPLGRFSLQKLQDGPAELSELLHILLVDAALLPW